MEHTKLDKLIEQASAILRESVHDTQSLHRWKTQMFTLINAIAELKMPSLSDDNQENSSLDPVDWTSARYLAHEMLDSSLDYIQHVRDRPVWQSLPDDVRAAIEDEPFPERGQSLSGACSDVTKYIIPYARGIIHPRFFGWVSSEGTLAGVIGDMLSATLNLNIAASVHNGLLVEKTVINWMCQLFGFTEKNAGGLLVSGTSMATVISMAAARQRVLVNVREDGLADGHRLVAYASTETHGCVVKALELVGLGSKALHLVPVDENFGIDIPELKSAIQKDRDSGLTPFCIVGNAGTVNTGCFDDLLELSSIARAENMWLHVDGAFGGLIILDPQRRHFVTGINQVDSLAFDFHKWLHCPYDVGCLLVRDVANLESTFGHPQAYLKLSERDSGNNEPRFCDFGPELTRSFRALKVWLTLKEHGTVKLGQKIADNCEQAQYLVSLLEKHENIIHVVHPVLLNIVNFRFESEHHKTDPELIDTLNSELVNEIQISGLALPSTTRLQNRLYIRVCIVSHRCTCKDFDIFVEALLNLYQARIKLLQ